MRLFRLLLVGVLTGAALPAQEEPASSVRPAEYMIYQYPAVSLVVVVDALETEFNARINGPEGAFVSETGIASRRIGPRRAMDIWNWPKPRKTVLYR